MQLQALKLLTVSYINNDVREDESAGEENSHEEGCT